MKRLMTLLCVMVSLLSLSGTIAAKNLDSLPEAQRNKTLIKLAKEVVLRHGPGFYREYKAPLIKRQRVSDESIDLSIKWIEKYNGRSYYRVEYPYNSEEEMFNWDFSVQVFVWGDTGEVFIIAFGNGVMIGDYDLLSAKEKKALKVIPFKKRLPMKMICDTIRNEKGEVIMLKHKYR